MIAANRSLFEIYRHKGLLIDTNVLLLYIVGLVNRSRIEKFKRTQKFTPKDFDRLNEILAYFQKVITTPNIMTEVSNLTNQLNEPERSQCFEFIANIIANLEEVYTATQRLAANRSFAKFGITDVGIQTVAKELQCLVLTDDSKLAAILQAEGIDTINFDIIRSFGWQ
jgi:rRNA-processing protein FCF1